MPGYYDRYINLVDDIEILDAFDQSIQQIDQIDIEQLLQLGDNVYAPEKWTIKQIIQHVIDTERIFTERTTRFARQDGVTPQGFDENLFADNAKVNHRTLESLLKELKVSVWPARQCLKVLTMKQYSIPAITIIQKCPFWQWALQWLVTRFIILISSEKDISLYYKTKQDSGFIIVQLIRNLFQI